MSEEQQAAMSELDQSIQAEVIDSAPIETEPTEQVAPEAQEAEEAKPDDSDYVQTDSDKVQAKFNKMTWEKNEAIRAQQAAEKRLADFEAKQPEQTTVKSEPKIEDFKEEDFGYDESARNLAYLEARQDHFRIVDRENSVIEQQQKTQAAAAMEVQQNFAKAQDEYAIQNPDYLKDIEALNQSIKFPNDTLAQVMKQGPKMVHYLSKHLDVADSIANGSPTDAAFKLGTISINLGKPKPVNNISSSPDPVETIQGSGGITKDLGEMSIAELMNTKIG